MKNKIENQQRLYLPNCSLAATDRLERLYMESSMELIRDRVEKYECATLNDIELLVALSGIKPSKAAAILQQYHLHEIPEYLECINPLLTKRQKQVITLVHEFSKRLYRKPSEKEYAINNPQDVFTIMESEMRYPKKEVFVCSHLNAKNIMLRKDTVSIGSLNSSIVHPREVFTNAVKHNVSAVVFYHNYPSGDPCESMEDVETTRRLVKAGESIGIRVLGHIIIGNGRYVSLREKGLI